jgi:ferredoxin--NADP+ reductase
MTNLKGGQHLVVVVGAGPAGIYAVRKLVAEGHVVILLNRDVKPGGLAEYGIFPTKYKMKDGLRKQFKKILSDPRVFYFGHVSVGEGKDITLKALEGIGLSAIVVSAGAQGTKKLGIPGEDCVGVYHAKDVVYHYNSLPPFSQRRYEIGSRVAIIGMGNVMVDVANWLFHFKGVREVLVVARRGPKEKAYDKKEFEVIERYLDVEDMVREIARIKPRLEAVGQNVEEITPTLDKESVPPSDQRLRFRYLCSPCRVFPDSRGKVAALEVEENELTLQGERTVAHGLGQMRQFPVDNVIYAIGDQVDPAIGIPFSRGIFITNPEDHPGDPNPAPYQGYDPQARKVLEGVFLVGWARNASVGLVGIAKQDAEKGIIVVNGYLAAREGFPPKEIDQKIEALMKHLKDAGNSFVTKEDVEVLESVEKEEALKHNVKEFKFTSDEEMLTVIAARNQTREKGSMAAGVANGPIRKK